jgi:hypothetical protein
MLELDRAACHLTDCRLALHSRVVVVAAQNDGTSMLHFRSHTPLQLGRVPPHDDVHLLESISHHSHRRRAPECEKFGK